MSKIFIKNINLTKRKAVIGLTIGVAAFVVMTLTQDFLRANLNNSGFYFSESFIFSSFWWIFVPLLYAQYVVVKQVHTKPLFIQLAVLLLPVILHIVAFPFIVWGLSSIFHYHTFAFQQTLNYTLSEHLYLLILFYSIPFFIYRFIYSTPTTEEKVVAIPKNSVNHFIETILVSEGNKKHCIAVADILYFSANPPYINIHLDEKKYLHNDTLKSIAIKVNPEQFVRVHKSLIVNIKMVALYTSRLNGDYDLTMKNDVQLRVSRNYAIDFKQKFMESHRLTQK